MNESRLLGIWFRTLLRVIVVVAQQAGSAGSRDPGGSASILGFGEVAANQR